MRTILIGFCSVAIAGNAFSDTTPSVSAYQNTFFLSATGTLRATGENSSGQLGIGDKFSRFLYHTISFPPAATQVSAGSAFTYVLKSDGTLWASGSGGSGTLGDGKSNSSTTTFIQVGADSDWKQISTGYGFVMGIKNNGSLWGWGFSSNGALGAGTFLFVPTRIGTGTDWKSVDSGMDHNLAIKTNGTLWAWGSNSYGKLGNGNNTAQFTPVQIGNLTNWQSVAAGASHSLAIRTDGSLWAWGANASGQLGTGGTNSSNVPVRVGTGNQWKAVSAGTFHSLGQLTDNTLLAWGGNASGQLGVGDTTSRATPAPLATGGTWLSFDAGNLHSAAIRSNGTPVVWGDNSRGQLGPAAALVTMPQDANFTARPEIAVSAELYPDDSNLAVDGLAKIDYPLTAEQTPRPVPITIYNHGTAPLTVSAMTIPAGFSISPQAPFTLAPGESKKSTATLDTTVPGNLAGNLTISSNDADEANFKIALTGTVLSALNDTDGDGLNDAAEWYYISLGFRWDNPQPDLVSILFAGGSRAGLLPPAALLAGTQNSTVMRKNPATGTAALKVRAQHSLDMAGFFQSEVPPSIATNGSIELPLTPGARSEFFRFSVEPILNPEP